MRTLLKNDLLQELEYIYKEFMDNLEELEHFSVRIDLLIIIADELNRKDGIFRLFNRKNEEIDFTHDKELFELMPIDMKNVYEAMVCKQLITNHCSLFENFILSVIMKLYLNKPDLILANDSKARQEQVITYKELFEYNTLEDIIVNKIQEKIGKLTYVSIDKSINKIKLFYKNFSMHEDLLNKLCDTYVIRNVIVHNKGVVNQQFIDKIKNKKSYKLGDPIQLKLSSFNENESSDAITVLFKEAANIVYNFLVENEKSS